MKDSTKKLLASLGISAGIFVLNMMKDGIHEKNEEEMIEKKVREAVAKAKNEE